MHSSRMRTVRSSGRILGGCTWFWGVPGVGGVYLVPGGCLCLVGGCTWSWGVYLVLGGVPGPVEFVYLVPEGCTWSRGMYLVPGGTWSGTPPCGQTDACKNITFATSLRTVIKVEGTFSGHIGCTMRWPS